MRTQIVDPILAHFPKVVFSLFPVFRFFGVFHFFPILCFSFFFFRNWKFDVFSPLWNVIMVVGMLKLDVFFICLGRGIFFGIENLIFLQRCGTLTFRFYVFLFAYGFRIHVRVGLFWNYMFL